MLLIIFNLDWMLTNSLLALLPVFAGWLFLYLRQWYWRVFFGLTWLFFVPNTIYILTDVIHIPSQIQQASGGIDLMLLLLQYGIFEIIGLVTFILAVYPIEKLLLSKRKRHHTLDTDFVLASLNFIIAFGVMLGRFQRTNSWEVATNTVKVIQDVQLVLLSPQILFIVLIFGIICNGLYFSLRDHILRVKI